MNSSKVESVEQKNDNQNKMSGLRITFISKWSFNPYQKLLVEELTNKIGVQVTELDRHTVFLPILIKQGWPNIVHFQSMHLFFLKKSRLESLIMLFLFVAQLIILRLLGVKIIWTAHDLKNHANKHLKIDHYGTMIVCWIIHGIIAHCSAAQKEVERKFRLENANKVFVVPHGNYVGYYKNHITKIEAQNKLSVSHSKIVLLFFGWIRGYKGLVELIKIFKQLPSDEVNLVIAGKPKSDEIHQLINDEISSHENINLNAQFIPDDQVQVYMNACDAVVFPYRDILTSGAVILAMSFNKACIAPRIGCIGEILDDSGAFLYNPDDPEGLQKAMHRAITARDNLTAMGHHNRQQAEKWSWELVAEKTYEVYQTCLGTGGIQ